jgi:predicted nucleic acid-binding protein
MITAIDTSVLLKILKREPDAAQAIAALESAANQGSLCICSVVVAELGRFFKTNDLLLQFLQDAHLSPANIDQTCALKAADIMRVYAKSKGEKTRIAADFLIGAHALVYADQLLTTDTGFSRQYFKPLPIIGI